MATRSKKTRWFDIFDFYGFFHINRSINERSPSKHLLLYGNQGSSPELSKERSLDERKQHGSRATVEDWADRITSGIPNQSGFLGSFYSQLMKMRMNSKHPVESLVYLLKESDLEVDGVKLIDVLIFVPYV